MSFSWAITDKRYEHQPWKHETFNGYFTDIRRAARKSLPRRPNKDMCKMLGLAVTPGRLEHDVGNIDKRLSDSTSSVPVSLKPMIIQTADVPPDSLTNEKHSWLDKLKDALLCRTSRTENCSKREKTVFGFAVYFAIIIFILLIIVLILSTTLSQLNDDDASDDARPGEATVSTVSTFETTITKESSASKTTSKTVDKSTTISFTKLTPEVSPGSSTSTETLTSYTRRSSSKTVTTTTASVSTSVERSTLSLSSTRSSTSLKTISSKTKSTKTFTTNSKSPVSSSMSSSISTVAPVSSTISNIKTSKTSTSIEATTQSSQSPLLSSSSSSVPLATTIPTSAATAFPSVTPSSATWSSIPTQTSDPSLTTDKSTKGSSEPSASPKPSSFTRQSTSAPTSDTVSTTKLITKATSEISITPTTSSTTVAPALFPILDQPDITCTSSTCLAANKTLTRVDFDKSPCVDFYEFSCGRWTQELNVKQQKGSAKNIPESVQEELRQNLLLEIKKILQKTYRGDESFSTKVTKRLYQSCMESNEATQIVLGDISRSQTMQEVHAFLDPLGMKADGSIESTLETLLKAAVTQFRVTPFFKMSPTAAIGEDGIKVHALKIEPPSLYLNFTTYRQPVENGKVSYGYIEGLSQILSSYMSSFSSRQKRQTEDESTSVSSFDESFNRVLGMYYIEANISNILENTLTTGDVLNTTLQYTYSELKVIYPFITWDAALGQDRNFLVQLVDFEYFEALNRLWGYLNDDDMQLYVFMNVLVKRVWTYMKLPFRMMLSNVFADVDMAYTDIDCVEMALELASEEIHALYIGQFTRTVLNNRLKLTNLENKISEAFQKYVSAPNWIQPDLEIAVTNLARNVKMQFSLIRTNVRQTRNITGGAQSFLSLSLELHRQKYEVEMNRLGSEVTEIKMDWTSTRPEFDVYFNAIYGTVLMQKLH